MPTVERFYFPRSGTVAATPAVGSQWEVSTGFDRMPLSVSGSIDASNSTVSLTETSATVVDRLHHQYVEANTLTARTLAGTFKLVMQGYESTNGADCYLQCVVRVIDGAGTLERGVLYGGQTPTTPSGNPADPHGEFSQSPVQTRVVTGTMSPVTVTAGDRRVVEIGARHCNLTATSTSTFLRTGAVAAHSDLADTAGTTTDGRPYIEFTWIDPPNVPTSLAETHDHESIDFTWAAPSGGDAATGYEVRIDGGSWIDVGNVFAHTFSSLAASTAYTMDVRAYNLAGAGASDDLSTTTDAAPFVGPTPEPAQARVPLTVRIGNRHVTRELSGLSFRKEAVGGLKSISLRLARTLDGFDATLTPLSSVVIQDASTAETIAAASLTDSGRSATASDGQQWDMVAFGPSQTLADQTFPYILIDQSLEPWRRSEYSTKNATTQADERGIDTPVLQIESPEGKTTVNANWQGDWIYRAIRRADMTLARIACDWDSGVTDSDYQLAAYTRVGSAASPGNVDNDNANTAGGSLAAKLGDTNFTAGDDVVSLRALRNNTNTTGAESHWFQFYNVFVLAQRKSASGSDVTTGYTVNYVLAHQVVNDLLGRVLDQFDGTNATVDTGGTYEIDQLAYPDGITAEQVLADLMALEPAYRWTTGPNVTGDGYSFSWEPWPTTVRYEVTLNDGGEFPSSAQELYNEVTVRWRGKNGLSRTVTRTMACDLLDNADPPRVRSTIIDAADEIGSTAAATRLGDNFLAEHNVPANAGTINISRPIRDVIAGRWVRPHEIQEAELIRVRGVESHQDALNASSNDGQTVFRIWSVTYSSDTDSAACELDIPSRSTTNALVKLAKRRNRKR